MDVEIGRYQTEKAQASCLKCLPGKYQDKLGQGTSSCVHCPEGFYQGGSGESSCEGKTEGKVVDEKRSSQSDVPEGSMFVVIVFGFHIVTISTHSSWR